MINEMNYRWMQKSCTKYYHSTNRGSGNKWSEHPSHITSKMSCGIGVQLKVKQYLHKEALLKFYYSLNHPYFYFLKLLRVWGLGTYVSNLNELIRLENITLRIIFYTESYVH